MDAMAYDTVMTDSDTRVRHDAVAQSRTFRNVKQQLQLGSKRVLDAGCGFGEYLTHFGPGSLGITTTPEEVAYAKEHGLAVNQGNIERLRDATSEELFDVVWANNVFEHLLSPHSFLMQMKKQVHADGLCVLGVPVVPWAAALTRLRWFRGALASNHINFFTMMTLRLTAERAGWSVVDCRPFYVRTRVFDRLFAPCAPHLYLVLRNDPSFVYPKKKIKEWQGDSHYAELLALGGQRP